MHNPFICVCVCVCVVGRNQYSYKQGWGYIDAKAVTNKKLCLFFFTILVENATTPELLINGHPIDVIIKVAYRFISSLSNNIFYIGGEKRSSTTYSTFIVHRHE
jgi:hypothetical protein